MDITQELEETVDLSTEYKGQTIDFTADKASLTPAFVRNISKIEDYPKAVASVVKKWNVTAHGEQWPLDQGSLERLPTKLLSAIIDRIGETWAGDAKKNTPSANTSAATAS